MSFPLNIIIFLFIIVFTPFCGSDDNEKDLTPPDKEPSKTEINVLTFKKMSNNDLEMIQKAIDYAAANKIKTVIIPDGEYLINAGNNPAIDGIQLNDNIHLNLSDKAILRAIPNKQDRYYIVTLNGVSNVEISGGVIEGDRKEHIGTTGEWGYGLAVLGSSNITIRDININDCWGDGILVSRSSKNILIERAICDNNRRQGMSVISVNELIVKESIFKNTNGTAPQSGIDLEPDNTSNQVKNILIENCKFLNNAGLGLHMYGKHGPVNNIKVVNCIVDNNPIGVSLRYDGVNNIELSDIKITNSRDEGLRIFDGAKDSKVSNVTIDNSNKRAVRIENAVNIELSDIGINEYKTEGILINKSSDVRIRSTTLQTTNVVPNGFNILNSQAVELSKLDIKGGKIGVNCSNSEDIELSGSTLSRQVENGVILNKTNSTKIHQNSFEKIARTPISVINSINNKIFNNTFSENCHSTDNTYSQVYFQGTSQNNEFNDNTIPKSTLANKAKYGVWLTSTTKSNMIFGNMIDSESYRDSAIKDEGQNN